MGHIIDRCISADNYTQTARPSFHFSLFNYPEGRGVEGLGTRLATVRAYGVIRVFCTLVVVRQQLHGSRERSMQAIRTLSVRSFVPDH